MGCFASKGASGKGASRSSAPPASAQKAAKGEGSARGLYVIAEGDGDEEASRTPPVAAPDAAKGPLRRLPSPPVVPRGAAANGAGGGGAPGHSPPLSDSVGWTRTHILASNRSSGGAEALHLAVAEGGGAGEARGSDNEGSARAEIGESGEVGEAGEAGEGAGTPVEAEEGDGVRVGKALAPAGEEEQGVGGEGIKLQLEADSAGGEEGAAQDAARSRTGEQGEGEGEGGVAAGASGSSRPASESSVSRVSDEGSVGGGNEAAGRPASVGEATTGVVTTPRGLGLVDRVRESMKAYTQGHQEGGEEDRGDEEAGDRGGEGSDAGDGVTASGKVGVAMGMPHATEPWLGCGRPSIPSALLALPAAVPA